MNRSAVKDVLVKLTHDIESITDDNVKSTQKTLLNLIELLFSENDELRSENQRLRNENNRLKGEQGKPTVRHQTQHISSEKERNGGRSDKTRKPKNCKRNTIKIDRVETCKIDKTKLPSDAKFKGYKSVFVQDLVIKTDNIEFRKEVYYSRSLNKTFMAPLPAGYEGEFGPFIKALVINLHKSMTEPAIVEFLNTHGVMISGSSVSRMLTDNNNSFHQEKNDIIEAGLSSSAYQQMDDTGARVNGKNYYTHILCNPFYTAYFTRPTKNRLTILGILTQDKLMFHFNESTYSLMEQMHLPAKTLALLREHPLNGTLNREEMDTLLTELFPNPKKHYTHRHIIVDAAAIMAYRQLPHALSLLLTDDAPQYTQIVNNFASCWVHDGRHYKKLTPVVHSHIREQQCFLKRYWEYYHQLLAYKKSPTELLAGQLSNEFDVIFSTKTGYAQLDARIEKTKMKKDSLLLALEYPELPLHNNASELGARRQARYRDISLHTKNEKGTLAKDTHMTITETAKKLCVNSFSYFYDRISGKYAMPSLASLIKS